MKYGKCDVHVSESAEQLGEAAAQAFADAVKTALADKDEMTAVLAAGESQTTFFAALSSRGDIPWQKIHCFNLDDFWDPNIPEKYTCGFQARQQLYGKVDPLSVQLVDFNAADPVAEAQRFEAELRTKAPFDIVCQGIGTSGHLALNEPHISRFDDPQWMRVVDVAEQSKIQLMEDPNFMAYGSIPDKGITMTIPALMSAKCILTIVPLELKRAIITDVLNHDTVTEELPATIIRNYPGTLFLDRDSCPSEI